MENIRKYIVGFCLKHCKNNFCNYLLFKLLNKDELKKITDALNFIQKHRDIKENFYG